MREIVEKLNQELRLLERELRIDLPKEIHKALSMGDLRENAEYHAALERQAYVKARIGQLRNRLSQLGTMNLDQVPRDRIGIGTTVTLLDLESDEEIVYELVLPEVSDLKSGLVSLASPIGKGLAGRRVGDEVEIPIPSGKRMFEVLEMKTLHDKRQEQE
jgi:transcription elongation factor GreA